MKKRRTKTFQSESINRLVRLERLVWLIPAAVAGKLLVKNASPLWAALRDDFSLATVIGVVFATFIYTLVMSMIPFYIVKTGFRHARQQQIRNSSFITIQDFDYYREKLEGLSPGAISLITDLKLEQQKDVAASLLKFEDMGILRCENDQYFPTEQYDAAALRPSERYLIDSVTQNRFHSHKDDTWQGLVEKETVEDGYVVPRKYAGGKQSEAKWQAVRGCLPTLALFIAAMVALTLLESRMDAMFAVFDAAGDLSLGDEMRLLGQSPEYLLLVGLLLLIAVLMIRGLFFPIAAIAGSLGILKNMAQFKRTDLGNEMAEYVFGMKNFIHDFSNLAQAEKEHLVLWDDYLIYAVVLEENRQIVQEIMNMRTNRRVLR